MSKPDWKDAQEWAAWLAQNGSPRFTWTWFEEKPAQTIHGWYPVNGSLCQSQAGELNLKWQHTLERRP